MITKLLRKLAVHRARAELQRIVDANANSREVRDYRMNRAAGKLGYARRCGRGGV